MRHALLVYPQIPPSYWGAQFALDILGIKTAFPPLGLLTVAAMFPPGYDLRVVDMNTAALDDSDLEWADLVFTSSMYVQKASLRDVVQRCNRAGVPVVAGGPYPTTFHDVIEGVDHFVLDEVEDTFGEFLRDLESGTARAIYREPGKPDVTKTPVPRFDLIDMKDYYSMCVQFSRGCPFDCEFCDITKLFGRVPRTKSPEQMVEEFESLYRLGWRGQVFVVDDNFIANKRDAKRLLPVIAEWQKERGYPFTLFTEATVNMARMDKLLDGMVEAGFNSVFLGIETPNPEALRTMKKPQNISKQDESYLLHSVQTIQRKGMQVMGGFILGLDDDDESAFDAQIEFIQEAGIPIAPVGLLTAIRGTDLYARLERENRLLDQDFAGDHAPINLVGVNVPLNFRPQMDPEILAEGYRRVITTIYDPTLKNFFKRCLTLFEHLEPVPHLLPKPLSKNALLGSMMFMRQRLSPKQVPVYMDFIGKVSKRHPCMLREAIRLTAMGYHCEKITRQQMAIEDFKQFLAVELAAFGEAVSPDGRQVDDARDRSRTLLARVDARYRSIPGDFRYEQDGVEDALESFRSAVDARTGGLESVAVA